MSDEHQDWIYRSAFIAVWLLTWAGCEAFGSTVHTHMDLTEDAVITHNGEVVHVGADVGYYCDPDSTGTFLGSCEGFAHLAQFHVAAPDSIDVPVSYGGIVYVVAWEGYTWFSFPSGAQVWSRYFDDHTRLAGTPVRIPRPERQCYILTCGMTSGWPWWHLDPWPQAWE